MKEKMIHLLKMGVPQGCSSIPVVEAFCFQKSGGLRIRDYWNSKDYQFDEFMIMANTYMAIYRIIRKDSKNDKRKDFDWYYMLQIKQNIQTIKSIYVLIKNKCYFDAAIIIRSLQSRLLQLLLFTLEPSSTDNWAKNPENKEYREGNIRKKLMNYGIEVWEHIYLKGNTIVHSNWKGLEEYGLFEKGFFPLIEYDKNLILVCAKYFIGITAFIGYYVNQDENLSEKEVDQYSKLFNYFKNMLLADNRVDHISFNFKKQQIDETNNINNSIEYASFDFDKLKELINKIYSK